MTTPTPARECVERVADDWVDWAGGESPVPSNVRVNLRLRNSSMLPMRAGDLDWSHEDWDSDITAYRIIT